MGEPSGGTNRVSAIAAGLADRGVDVTLVVPEPSGPVPDRLDPVECVYVETRRSSLVRAVSVARRAARRARTDDAVLQLEHSTLAGVGNLVGVDGYVLDMHDLGYSRFDHDDRAVAPILKRGVRRIERRGLDRADHVIVVSDVMADQISALTGIPDDSISVVPNGYFPETIEPYRDVATTPGRIVFLGTLHPKVDVDTLVGIADLRPVTDMVIIGDGAKRERIERAADRSNSLRATGRLPDSEAFELVASAQIVVNPQTVSTIQRSSSPVKLYYYAALGLPMVVTPGPSVVDHLVRNEAAVTARSRSHFLDRVRCLCEDEALATRVADNARDLAGNFTWTDRVEVIERIHRSKSGAGVEGQRT